MIFSFGKKRKPSAADKTAKTAAAKGKGKRKSAETDGQDVGKISVISLLTDLIKSGKDITETLSRMGLLGIFHFFNIFFVSGRKFNEDECSTKSSAIAYTTLVSLIPTLTVVLTFASIFAGVGAQKDQLFLRITRFLAEHNLEKLNVAPFFDAISGLLDNAAGIGVVGAAVTIFSATALLRTIESSLNSIFKVKKQRSIFIKIIYYWAALTLGPIIMITGTTLATQISKSLTAPDYYSAHVFDDGLWVSGSKGSVGLVNDVNSTVKRIPTDNVDFDNQKSFTFNPTDKVFIPEEISSIDETQLKAITFTDICFIGQKGWLIGEKGYILRTSDRGQSWSIEKRSYFNFRKIAMRDDMHGFIVGDSGIVLETSDGGESWIIRYSQTNAVDFNAIALSNTYGIIAGDRGYILTTDDAGANWYPRQLAEAKQKKHYSDFNSVIIQGNTILIAANDGLILKSDNAGSSWTTRKYRSYNYTAITAVSPTSYYLASSGGLVLKTTDDGETFRTISNGGVAITNIVATPSHLWITGRTGLLQYTRDDGMIWSGVKGKSFLLKFTNFFTPFLFIWLLFFLMFMALPNTKVPFRAAGIGASFTAAVWVLFIYFFIVYVNSFANGTFAVYGALAAFPLFLLLIYTSMQIILFGAELAYTLSNPHTYRRIRKKGHHAYGNAVNAVRMLAHIYRKFESGKGSSGLDELIKTCNNNHEEATLFIDIFTKGTLISLSDERYIPAKSSRNIKISEILDMVYDFSLDLRSQDKDPVSQHLHVKFAEIQLARTKILSDERLADII